MNENVPRIYTSFAEFDREELRRCGLAVWPSPAVTASPPAVVASSITTPPAPSTLIPMPALPSPASAVTVSSRSVVTPESLRAEGILEIGCAKGTSVLFVRTHVKLHLLHATGLPDRKLDDYAVRMAVTWIEDHGLASCEVAKNLGVSEPTLRSALAVAGYERLTPKQRASCATARSARKLGNRRGRLVCANADAHAESCP